ncbi:hypothetical protein QCA50_015362 [Cerrena zonata]|uniref:Zn(2)-C6 fungal-type domain-containing protein n=1 Tax=Cerrena zonata TaxID=2478898 RepID=A0AAW0FKH1_9APHY
MATDSNYDSQMPPLQFKGEILDFDLGLEVDHRKRRRNRTTQSCLNCHTSKRKCDRKRPCQRCIQLGLTGLCVYEVDDPALRDDPNLDETTRLRNRIAELESLVRELRGKPHPRWADANFCDGDASEKWHSRSSRRVQSQMQRQKREQDDNGHSMDVSPVKVEQSADMSHRQLYRMSPSPPMSAHPHQHQGDCSPVENANINSYQSSSTIGYGHHRQHAPPSLSMPNNNDLYYHQPYIKPAVSSPIHPSCTCLTNPAAGNPLIALIQQLQQTLQLLRQLPEHNSRHQCIILKRIVELHDLMHGGSASVEIDVTHSHSQFEALPTPTETEIMSPISTSSHSSNVMHHEWPMSATSTSHYDNYFPVTQPEHGVYHKTYHIN